MGNDKKVGPKRGFAPRQSSHNKPARAHKDGAPVKFRNQNRSMAKNQNCNKEAEKNAAKLQKIQNRNAIKERKVAEAEAERTRSQQEKDERIRIYKKKRLEKTKAISKRTQRGQPLMKDRMQLLLKQIQEQRNAFAQ